MKTCPKCQQTKPSSDYSKKRSAKDGLFYCCKDCWKEHSKEYSTNNRDKIAEYQKEHRARPEVKERYNEWQREQYKNNPQKRLRIKISSETKSTLLGVHSNMTIVSEKYGMKKIGLTTVQYREYIESLWTEGMSWDNYGHGKGKWCIDHIDPKNFFDLTDPELYRKCSHYTNTQPMWYMDNMSKGDRLLD